MNFQELKNKVFGLERKVLGLQCCVSQLEDGGGGGGAVSSVFGRTGVVTAQNNDYTFAQLASKPTTLSGYGITDATSDAELTAFIGSSNITTLGTITSGTWNGTTIDVANGGTGQSTLTANKILVGNGTTGILSPSNLHWDNGNSRLGIANTSPTARLTITGVGTTGSTYGLDILNSSSGSVLRVRDDSTMLLGSGVTNAQFIINSTGSSAGIFSPAYSSGSSNIISFKDFGGTARATLDMSSSSGLLGINTTAPTHTITLGSTSTGVRLYNTSDQTTNYERGGVYWNSNALNIRTEQGGSGAARNVIIGSSSPTLTIFGSSNTVGWFNFFGATSTANANVVSIAGTGSTLSASSGINSTLAIGNHINQSGSAGFRSLFISPYVQATGSGSKLLADIGTNTAVNYGGTHTSLFSISNTGVLTITAPIYADNSAATSGGLVAGNVYKTATGELRIVV